MSDQYRCPLCGHTERIKSGRGYFAAQRHHRSIGCTTPTALAEASPEVPNIENTNQKESKP